MLLDLEHPSCPLQFEVDICIVGAGPAGITIAQQLIGRGLRVCLAEGGGWTEDAGSQGLFEGESIGHPMDPAYGRYRLFGGSASRWGGRCAMLDRIDFEERSWIRHSGWPVSLDALRPYYERAKVVSNFLRPWVDDKAGIASISRKIPDFGSQDVSPFVWRAASRDLPITWRSYLSLGYNPKFDWGRSYKEQITSDPDTFLVLHANLVSMTARSSGKSIGMALFKSMNGNCLAVRARAFAICCGGIENARIALNLPEEILERTNRYGNIGRYFAQHPRGRIISMNTSRAQGLALQKTFNIFSRPTRYPVQYELGFALSERAQREHRILNASAAFYYFPPADSAWAAGRRLRDALRARELSRVSPGDMATVARNSISMANELFKKYVSAFELNLANPIAEVYVDLEQAPDPESRVRLLDEKDRLGVRRVEVDWRISDLERKTARVLAEGIAEVLERLNLGKSELADWLFGTDPIRQEDLRGNYHFIGATRMANNPVDGVLNPNCRAFEVTNLFFAGASVFPTGGHANPTLTIVALAIRLADHLRLEFPPVRNV